MILFIEAVEEENIKGYEYFLQALYMGCNDTEKSLYDIIKINGPQYLSQKKRKKKT